MDPLPPSEEVSAGGDAKTLETHIRSIFTKLDLRADPADHRRVAAVVRWLHSRP